MIEIKILQQFTLHRNIRRMLNASCRNKGRTHFHPRLRAGSTNHSFWNQLPCWPLAEVEFQDPVESLAPQEVCGLQALLLISVPKLQLVMPTFYS